ncbi:S9 family peptidase [Uliginosibacterium gangwonense]|uniref:S9 family peptidase n=1 Tax=Uliginosibacterium gangwonense TaxID=392736 RepID=UPI000475B3CC|nr:S9 family peptidase [Uliginosibacterium gangwonense]
MPDVLRPPAPAQHPATLCHHGIRREDPYLWMHKLHSADMLAHLEAENAFATAVMAETLPLQEQLYAEMLARIQEVDLSVPVRFGAWMYYSRTEQGAQYAIHCRKRITDVGWESSAEEVLLNENLQAHGKPFYEVGDYEVSPSGRYLAWTEDTRGQREYTLRLRDLFTGKTLSQRRRGVTSLCWAEDDMTLFYVSEDPKTHRANKLWRLRLFEGQDTQLFEEHDERFNLLVFKTRSLGYIVANSSSHTTSEARILPADRPEGRWRIVCRRRAGIEYEVDHHSDHLLLRVNDTGPNFRLVHVPLKQGGGFDTWQEVIPHRDDVILEGVDIYRDWRVTSERIDGVPRLAVARLADGHNHCLSFDDPTFMVDLEDLPEWETPSLRYTYESMTTPDSIYDYDPITQVSTLLRRQPVLGDFDPTHYRSERLHALAADGTQIPISLVYRTDIARNGNAPVWLDGYGAYGMASDPWFSSTRLSLLDRGWVFAIAHVRGGGELGQRWHDDGRLEHKENSFGDYIACAETLIAQGFTRAGRILAQGGSAGGLLIGAVLNRRPELFGAAILEVPFVDVLTTMLDPDLPLTIGEYEEWGDPRHKRDFLRMQAYSPYDNLAPRPYPPLLVEAGLHDSQVMAWEPAKYVARLREVKTDPHPVLLFTNMSAGHGGASGRYDTLHERARQLAFALTRLPTGA